MLWTSHRRSQNIPVKLCFHIADRQGEGSGKYMKRNQEDSPCLLFTKSLWLGEPGREKGWVGLGRENPGVIALNVSLWAALTLWRQKPEGNNSSRLVGWEGRDHNQIWSPANNAPTPLCTTVSQTAGCTYSYLSKTEKETRRQGPQHGYCKRKKKTNTEGRLKIHTTWMIYSREQRN